jgi:hypothetical protein
MTTQWHIKRNQGIEILQIEIQEMAENEGTTLLNLTLLNLREVEVLEEEGLVEAAILVETNQWNLRPLPAISAKRDAKCHLNQVLINLFFAAIVSKEIQVLQRV